MSFHVARHFESRLHEFYNALKCRHVHASGELPKARVCGGLGRWASYLETIFRGLLTNRSAPFDFPDASATIPPPPSMPPPPPPPVAQIGLPPLGPEAAMVLSEIGGSQCPRCGECGIKDDDECIRVHCICGHIYCHSCGAGMLTGEQCRRHMMLGVCPLFPRGPPPNKLKDLLAQARNSEQGGVASAMRIPPPPSVPPPPPPSCL